MSTPPITPSPSHEFGRAIAHAGAYLASKIAELVPSILKEHRATAIRHTFEHQNVLSFQAEAAVNDSHDILMNALSLETLTHLYHHEPRLGRNWARFR